MEPRLQYAKTTDGVSIAFYALGEGMPLVYLPAIPWSHIQLEWQGRRFRDWSQRLAQRRMLVRYDGRRTGLSDRDVADYSLDAHVLDLEAVVGRLRLERIGLLAEIHSGPVAIAYAARNPERVSHLILWCSYARASDVLGDPTAQGLNELARTDWRLFTRTVANMVLGWEAGGGARGMAEFFRASTTQEAYLASLEAGRQVDVTALLPQVKSATLVLHRRQLEWPEVGLARDLTSRIPNARLTVLEGRSVMILEGDTEPLLRAIDEFLGEGDETETGAEGLSADIVYTILFTDVEGSTALTDRLGDAKARELLREHERMVRDALKAHGGSEVKAMGDGFMASFGSATKALECAIAMQRAFAEHNENADEPIRVRVGLNAGEPIVEDDPGGRADLFGTAVNEAARITATAKGGEILASNVVRELVAGKGFMFSDRGETELRGFEDPVRLYEVRWREET
jgi:class 3 adenylate cyclase